LRPSPGRGSNTKYNSATPLCARRIPAPSPCGAYAQICSWQICARRIPAPSPFGAYAQILRGGFVPSLQKLRFAALLDSRSSRPKLCSKSFASLRFWTPDPPGRNYAPKASLRCAFGLQILLAGTMLQKLRFAALLDSRSSWPKLCSKSFASLRFWTPDPPGRNYAPKASLRCAFGLQILLAGTMTKASTPIRSLWSRCFSAPSVFHFFLSLELLAPRPDPAAVAAHPLRRCAPARRERTRGRGRR